MHDFPLSRLELSDAKVVVVIPTLNEEQSIASVVRELPKSIVSRIIVSDGGSGDETVARARSAGAEVVAAGHGYGQACLRAAELAQDADILVFIDGDGADDPRVLPELVDPIKSGEYEFVIGSRVRGVREPGSMAWHQIIAGLAVGWLTHLFYGVRYTEMCAYRAIRRDRLLTLGMRELTYGWNLEMQMRAAHAGLRILEVPVPYRRRTGGTSKVSGSLHGSFRAGLHIAAAFARIASAPARSRAAGS